MYITFDLPTEYSRYMPDGMLDQYYREKYSFIEMKLIARHIYEVQPDALFTLDLMDVKYVTGDIYFLNKHITLLIDKDFNEKFNALEALLKSL